MKSDEATLVPILLQFSGVARNENLSIEIRTPGVAWSMGQAEAGEVGFSLNPMKLGNAQISCIKSLELAESVLAIHTGGVATNGNVADGSFTLSAFLRCQDVLGNIDGYCSMNIGATVLASIQSQQSVEWRRGPISATFIKTDARFMPIRFEIHELRAGKSVVLKLQANSFRGRTLRWSFGPPVTLGNGLVMRSSSGAPAGLSQVRIDETTLVLVCGPTQVGADAGELMLELGIETGPLLNPNGSGASIERDWLSLMAEHDQNVTVVAQLGTQLPKNVVDSFTPFSL